jgi:hypothetical protein
VTWCYWCSWLGLRGSVAVGRRRGRTGGGTGAHRRCGPAVLEEETEIGLLSELLGVAAVLLMHWIGVQRRCGWLSTVARDGGGGSSEGLSSGEESAVG